MKSLGASRSLDPTVSTVEAEAREHLRWRDLFEASPDPTFVTDGYGCLLAVNAAAGDHLEAPLPELHRKPLAVFLPLDRRREFRAALLRAAREPVRLSTSLRGRRGRMTPVDLVSVLLPRGAILWVARLADPADTDGGDEG